MNDNQLILVKISIIIFILQNLIKSEISKREKTNPRITKDLQHGKTEHPFSDSAGLVILRKYNFLIGFYGQSRLFHLVSRPLGGAKQEIVKKSHLITRKQNM